MIMLRIRRLVSVGWMLVPCCQLAALGMDTGEVVRAWQHTVDELARSRAVIADEKIPLVKELSELEGALLTSKKAYEERRRTADNRSLELNNVQKDIKRRTEDQEYLFNLFSEYIRNFESRLHIAELRMYEPVLEPARLAPEKTDRSPAERFDLQVEVIEAGLDRIESLLGGTTFPGRAADDQGIVREGSFALIGPVAVFSSSDGSVAGLVEQRLGSLEPAVVEFLDPLQNDAVRTLVAKGEGMLPFDGSLGNARKIESTRETVAEHIAKGGAVIYPILGLAGILLLIAVIKWVGFFQVRLPGRSAREALLTAIRKNDRKGAQQLATDMKGAPGRMVLAALDRWDAPRDAIEEAMYEVMLDVRFKLFRGLPFIAVGAACAPLMGLLGTVTGIIATFKLITIFGSGDVKMLSAGISEALVTTEFGLIVAIPALLSHSFLSRRAKALQDKLEQLAIACLGAMHEAIDPDPEVNGDSSPPLESQPVVEMEADAGELENS